MTDNPNNKFADDVCHCIECATENDPYDDAASYDFIPDEQEKEEMKQVIEVYHPGGIW